MRAKRVREALVTAKQREKRREAVLEKILAKEPVAPEGVLAPFRQKAYRQTVAAWDSAKAAAKQLVDQACALVRRIKTIADPKRVAAWAHALYREREREQTKAKNRQEALGVEKVQTARGSDTAQQSRDPAAAPKREEPSEARDGWISARDKPPPSQQFDKLVPALPDSVATARPGGKIAETAWRWKELQQLEAQRRLTVQERRELVYCFEIVLEGIVQGTVPKAHEAQQRSLMIGRDQAKRKLMAEVFLSLPAVEGTRSHPQLDRAYSYLDELDADMRSYGRSQIDADVERSRMRRLIAQAIVQTGVWSTVPKHHQEHVRSTDRDRNPHR